MRSSILSFLLLCLSSVAHCLSSTGTRLLVVLDSLNEKDKYTQLWDDLKGMLPMANVNDETLTPRYPDRGYQITYDIPKNDPDLFRLGERAYDHLLILPAKLKALGPSLTPQKILEFMKVEGNVLIGLSSEVQTPSSIVSLLLELDIHLPPDRGTIAIDHWNYDVQSSRDTHDTILVSPSTNHEPKTIRSDVKDFFNYDRPIVFPHIVPQVLGSESPLLTPIIYASPNALTYQPSEESRYVSEPWAVGEQLKLVSAMQARNSARLTVLGAAEAFEDKTFDAKVRDSGIRTWSQDMTVENANRAFSRQLSAWTFQELGVLKVNEINHALDTSPDTAESKWELEALNSTTMGAAQLNPKMYRIKNKVVFQISLSEYFVNRNNPFLPPDEDELQLEVTMLSPFHRLNLKPVYATQNASIWGATFTLPDQHGIFNFRVNYKRPFMSYIDEKRTVTVRHFAHDEWPRSFLIPGAYVWILGLWATIGGFLLFVAVWLFGGKSREERDEKKE